MMQTDPLMTFGARAFARFRTSQPDKKNQTLLAVYDFAASPTSFDFATFLALADLHRQQLGLRHTHVLFVPAPGTGFWDKEPIGLDEKRWRVRNMLVPLCSLWPTCSGVTVLGTRDEARPWLCWEDHRAIFPAGYRLGRPVADAFLWAAVSAERACGNVVPSWSAPPQAREFVRRWLEPRAQGRRVVVITLREAGYFSQANTNLQAWADFARSLDPKRYLPVILRDTEAIFAPVPTELQELTLFPEASLNVELRAALYETMFISLSIGTGPMMLQWLNPDCRCLTFRFLVPELLRGRAAPIRAHGLEIGGQLPGATRFQRIVWEDDRFEVIRREFDRMAADIDSVSNSAERVSSEQEPPLQTARRLREAHRLTSARRVYRHLLKSGQTPAAARCGLSLLELATPRRVHFWRYLRAFRHYLPALLQPGRGWTRVDEALEIADAKLHWRNVAAAEALYRSVIEVQPEHTVALHRLGVIALRRGMAADAVALFRRAIAGDPYRAEFHYDLGEALSQLGRPAEAAEQYRAALAQDASHQPAHERLASLREPLPAGAAKG